MTVTYTIESSLNLLYYLATDVCTGTEFIQVAREATQDDRYHPHMLVIYDLLSMAELNFDTSLFHQGVAYMSYLHSSGNLAKKTAIISRSKFASDFLSAFELMASGVMIRWQLFNDLKSTIRWLDLENATPQIQQIRKYLISANADKSLYIV